MRAEGTNATGSSLGLLGPLTVVLLAIPLGVGLAGRLGGSGEGIVYAEYLRKGSVVVGSELRARSFRSGRDWRIARGYPHCDAPAIVSPDGRQIAYCDKRGLTTVVDVVTGRKDRFGGVRWPDSWRPGGGLVGTGYLPERSKLELDGGRWRPLFLSDRHIRSRIVWITPTILATVLLPPEGTMQDAGEMNVLRLNGRKADVILRVAGAQPLVGLPQGRLLYGYRTKATGPFHLAIVTTDTLRWKRTDEWGDFVDAQRFDDGRIALLGRNARDASGGIYLFDDRDRKLHRLVRADVTGFAWLRDGRFVYSSQGVIRVADTEGKNSVDLPPRGDVRVLGAVRL